MVESAIRLVKGLVGLAFGAMIWFIATALLVGVLQHYGVEGHTTTFRCMWAALSIIILGGGIVEVLILYAIEQGEKSRDRE